MTSLIVFGAVVVIAAKIVGGIYLVQWWKGRSLEKAQKKAVHDFVDKIDKRSNNR